MNFYEFKKTDQEYTSVIRGSAFRIKASIIITGKLSPKERRAVAMVLFRQMKPAWKFFRYLSFEQLDNTSLMTRTITPVVPPGKPITTREGQLGSQIRFARLKMRLTLQEVSQKSGLPIAQLSLIERGLTRPRPKTLERIYKTIKMHRSEQTFIENRVREPNLLETPYESRKWAEDYIAAIRGRRMQSPLR